MDIAVGLLARSLNKKKAEVIRMAITDGLKSMKPKDNSAQRLLDLVKEAEKIPTVGKVPKDLIKNLDYYTWGGAKK